MEGEYSGRRAGPASDPNAVNDRVGRTGQERKTEELLHQGEELFGGGRYQQAIHVWTRVLFLDRGNLSARDGIDRAKRAIAEKQRKLDLMVAEAVQDLENGERRSARRQLARVLALDPRHADGRSLWEKLERSERRAEPVGAAASRVALPDRLEESPRTASRRAARAQTSRRRQSGSALKMAAFLFCALCLFALGSLYLHLNWDLLVGEEDFGSSRPSGRGALEESDSVAWPSLFELHYYSGARLYEKGLYREALAELAAVDRQCGCYEDARNLILRIEERLLREAIPPGRAEGSERERTRK